VMLMMMLWHLLLLHAAAAVDFLCCRQHYLTSGLYCGQSWIKCTFSFKQGGFTCSGFCLLTLDVINTLLFGQKCCCLHISCLTLLPSIASDIFSSLDFSIVVVGVPI